MAGFPSSPVLIFLDSFRLAIRGDAPHADHRVPPDAHQHGAKVLPRTVGPLEAACVEKKIARATTKLVRSALHQPAANPGDSSAYLESSLYFPEIARLSFVVQVAVAFGPVFAARQMYRALLQAPFLREPAPRLRQSALPAEQVNGRDAPAPTPKGCGGRMGWDRPDFAQPGCPGPCSCACHLQIKLPAHAAERKNIHLIPPVGRGQQMHFAQG